MKASVRWLREICPQLPDDANALAERFTAAGIEVEGVHPFGAAAEACLVAEVVSARPHPTRAGLRIVTVYVGATRSGAAVRDSQGGARREVVCGAGNVPGPGGLVVLAPLGAHLPAAGLTIEKRPIAGVESEGMLCSETELGLGDDANGILVLPPGTRSPGMSLAHAFPGARDTILELGLTPNRADGLGHVGLAREAAALFEVPFRPAPPPALTRSAEANPASDLSVVIEDAERCPHYGAAVLRSITVGPSPLEVRWRLGALGVRSISNVVDVTNLVMLEFGHPMHAFDFDKVRGPRIVVRRAREGEGFATLDGVARSLAADDLVICDADGPVALAGVMGGGNSEIVPSTTRVLLECAYFEPRGVRRAARRHGLHTESSHRFERGVDWGDTFAALSRAAELVAALAGATLEEGPRIVEARSLVRATVALRQTRVASLLGVEVSRPSVHAILDRLGFASRGSRAIAGAGDAWVDSWQVPSHRSDVTGEVDLIEEIARVRGYDSIPAELPAIHPSRQRGPRSARARLARQAGVAMGLSEAITYSFVAPRDLEAVGAPAPAVVLRNPLREEHSVMRTSLLPGLLQAVARARRHGERDALIFSVGTIFLASALPSALSSALSSAQPHPDERLAFAAILAGTRPAWLGKAQSVDVWDGKGLAEGLIRRLLRRDASIRPPSADERPRHLHPRGAAWIDVAGIRVGTLGPIHPDVVDAFGLSESPIAVELDLDALETVGAKPAAFVAPPRFPASLRDVAVVVRDEVTAGDLERAVREAAGELAEQVTLFDRFSGTGIPAGHASLALRVVYRAPDRTLTDAEVDARHAQVVAEIRSQFGGQLRA
jgi:phenylalanyl-tRNA synthetase beta chain